MPILPSTGPYPTYERVMNLARVFVLDAFAGATGTPGEGQILTDKSAFAIPMLRAVTQELYQELGNTGTGVVIRDNFILYNLAPLSHPDPAVQVSVSYTGYSNGQIVDPLNYLPPDFIMPLLLRERTSNTQNEFEDMHPVQSGLPSAMQTTAMAFWEWRNEKIWMPGSLLPKDIKIRYIAALELIDETITDLSQIVVPLQDCERALAYAIARDYGFSRGSDQVPIADTMRKEAVYLIKNRAIRQMQVIDFRAEAYGDNRLNLFPLDRYR